MRNLAIAIADAVLLLTTASAAQQYKPADWGRLRRCILANEACSLSASRATAPIASAVVISRALHFPQSLTARQQRVREIACEIGVDPALALALIQHESSFADPSITGAAGEVGPAQIMPSTAAEYGLDLQRLKTEFDYNVAAGVTILKDHLSHFKVDDALRAYNGGAAFQLSPPSVQQKVQQYSDAVLNLKASRFSYARCAKAEEHQ